MALPPEKDSPAHFKGREAIEHVAEAQAQGIMSAAEIHGTEAPGYISAGADAARDTAVAILLLWAILMHMHLSPAILIGILAVFGAGWGLWKCGRSAWLGWSRLERLHRLLEQERWEIQHHRQQERDELGALYASKGLEGKLLEDVLDVLMADDNRLLRVMVEEELGLSLASQEHPLKQALGALIGSLIATFICLSGLSIYLPFGIIISALIVIGCAGALSGYHFSNRIIPAVIWNIGVAVLSFGFVYFIIQYLV